MGNASMLFAAKVCASLALLAISATAPAAQGAGDPKKGKEIYWKVGCWGCHGFDGQGGVAGPKIAPDPMPADALLAFLRNASSTRMPPYDAKGLPDADVIHIRAFLATIPNAGDWKSNPLLKP